MSNPLTFLRPLRYDRVRSVLLVQTGAAAHLPEIVARVRREFPGCTVEALLREADGASGGTIGADGFTVARYEDRFELIAALRRRRFDVVAMQLGDATRRELRLLPFLLRTRAVIGFNDSLDYFPLNVFRIGAIARQLGESSRTEKSVVEAVLWIARYVVVETVLTPLTILYLLVAAGWLHARGWWRRLGEPAVREPEPDGRVGGPLHRARRAG